jgi:hypothetical protein
MLRRKATDEADERLEALCREFISALSKLARESVGEYKEVRSMALNRIVRESYDRSNFVEWMEAEKEHGKGRAKLIAGIHKRLAKEFIEKVETLSEDVEELRNEVDFHSHD